MSEHTFRRNNTKHVMKKQETLFKFHDGKNRSISPGIFMKHKNLISEERSFIYTYKHLPSRPVVLANSFKSFPKTLQAGLLLVCTFLFLGNLTLRKKLDNLKPVPDFFSFISSPPPPSTGGFGNSRLVVCCWSTIIDKKGKIIIQFHITFLLSFNYLLVVQYGLVLEAKLAIFEQVFDLKEKNETGILYQQFC